MDGGAKSELIIIILVLHAYLEPMIAKAIVGFSI